MTVQLILRHLRCDTLCQTWRIRKRRREMERPDLVGPIRPHPNIRLRAASSPRRDEIYHLEKNKLRNKFRQSSGNFCWNYLNPLERATSWCRVSNPFWTIHSRNGVGSLKFAKKKQKNVKQIWLIKWKWVAPFFLHGTFTTQLLETSVDALTSRTLFYFN